MDSYSGQVNNEGFLWQFSVLKIGFCWADVNCCIALTHKSIIHPLSLTHTHCSFSWMRFIDIKLLKQYCQGEGGQYNVFLSDCLPACLTSPSLSPSLIYFNWIHFSNCGVLEWTPYKQFCQSNQSLCGSIMKSLLSFCLLLNSINLAGIWYEYVMNNINHYFIKCVRACVRVCVYFHGLNTLSAFIQSCHLSVSSL